MTFDQPLLLLTLLAVAALAALFLLLLRRRSRYAVRFTNLDVLGEYRYSHTSVDVDLRDSSLARSRLQTELNTHSFLIGLGVRW